MFNWTIINFYQTKDFSKLINFNACIPITIIRRTKADVSAELVRTMEYHIKHDIGEEKIISVNGEIIRETNGQIEISITVVSKEHPPYCKECGQLIEHSIKKSICKFKFFKREIEGPHILKGS